MSTPVDEALSSQSKVAAERKEQDAHAWNVWRTDPTPENLHVLLHRFEPVFRSAVVNYKAPTVHTEAFRAELKKHALKAFQTYDPERGAALRTHLENHLRKAQRFNTQQQNHAYIPEGQTGYITPIDMAIGALSEQSGEEPSHAQIAQYLSENREVLRGKKPPTAHMVARIQGNRRKDLTESMFENPMAGRDASRDEAVLSVIKGSLNPRQLQVANYLFGWNGTQRVTETSSIAKRLGVSDSHVSRVRSEIAAIWEKHL